MQIRVKLFASLRERAGIPELELELSAGATVDDAVRTLRERVPAIQGYRTSVAYAVNRSYAKPDRLLNDGDELALIPPVSGG
ncbi:MAG: molybdopterin converting factor subunit 1 [Bacillota bacterium]